MKHTNPHMMVKNGDESHNTIRKKKEKQIPSLSHVFSIHLKVLKACVQTSEIFGNKKHAWMLPIHQETK